MFRHRQEDLVDKAEYQVGALWLTVAADTATGNRYRANFDQLHLDPRHPLMIVADGMGDSRGAWLAGRTTVEVLAERVGSLAARAEAGPVAPEQLRQCVAQVQSAVRSAGAESPDLTGCTLTALLAPPTATAGTTDQQAWIIQLGDSRAYRLRAGLLELLTSDHTMAWLGAAYGWFGPGSAEAVRARYQLLRYIGDPGGSEPDLLNVSLRPGDVYCLCTDGVAEQVSYQTLAAAMAEPDPRTTITRLLAACEASGGNDNATAIVLRVAE